MIRRWIIRSLFIALCVVCVGAWVGSYRWCAWLQCGWGDAKLLTVGIDCGALQIENRNMTYVADFSGHVARADNRTFQFTHNLLKYRWLGAAYDPDQGLWHDWELIVPLWLPTIMLALMLGLVWRKTQPNCQGKSFPIEPSVDAT